jgi:hypothetical protein
MKNRRDLLWFAIYLVIATLTIVFLNLNLLTIILLYLTVPSFYFCYNNRKFLKRILLYSIFCFIAFIPFDYVMELNYGWRVSTIFPFLVFNLITVEFLTWAFFTFILVTSFYENFFSTNGRKSNPSLKIFLSCISIYWVLFGIFFALGLNLVRFHYVYARIATIQLLILPIFIAWRLPSIRKLLLKMSFVFTIPWFVFEVVAVSRNMWFFPGEYMYLVNVFGVTFPIEEVIFWMFLTGPFIVATYLYFMTIGK